MCGRKGRKPTKRRQSPYVMEGPQQKRMNDSIGGSREVKESGGLVGPLGFCREDVISELGKGSFSERHGVGGEKIDWVIVGEG